MKKPQWSGLLPSLHLISFPPLLFHLLEPEIEGHYHEVICVNHEQ